MKFTIPTNRLPVLIKKLEKFNKKALKFRALPIVYTQSAEYLKEFESPDLQERREDKKYKVPVIDLEIDTQSFEPIKGYKFVASIEHSEKGNIILNKVVGLEIPKRYRTSNDFCDHCQTHRYRKMTYIVYNEKKKTFVQVGSTCIRDYLGISLDIIAGRFEFLKLFEEESDIHREGYGQSGVWTYELDKFLAICMNVIDLDGFVSGKMIYEYPDKYKQATGKETLNVMEGPYLRAPEDVVKWYRVRQAYTPEHKEEAVKIRAWVKTLDTNTDFYYNLSTIEANGYVTWKTANMAAAMVIGYRKAMDLLKPKKQFKPSEYVGTVGERIDVTVEYLKHFTCDTRFGLMHIVNLQANDGDRIIWNTGSFKLEEGKKYQMVATVKKHQTYKDMKQTVVTRPKFKEVV